MATRSKFSEITDCGFEARKYILKTKRSHWKKHRNRPIVYSPITTSYGSAEEMFVRRLDKQNNNQEFLSQDVCLIEKTDIEPDNAKIYERTGISKEPVIQHAHGVVLVDEISSSGCQFLRGDRLWLMIGSNTDTEIKDIPVINLRSLKAGTVKIDNVCWYPVARGEKESLLTFGGVLRELRLGRERRPMNWVIVQSSDSKVWCRMIELHEAIRLTGKEREKQFSDKLRLIDPMLTGKHRGGLPSPSASPTPPLSPFQRSKEMQAVQRTIFWLKYMRDAKDQSIKPPSVTSSDDVENSSEPHSELENMFRSRLQAIQKKCNESANQEIRQNMCSELAISFTILFSCQQALMASGPARARGPMNSQERPAFDVSNPIIAKNPHLIRTSFIILHEFQEEKGYLFGSPFDLLRGEDRVMQEMNRLMEEGKLHCSNNDQFCPFSDQPNIWATHFHFHMSSRDCSLNGFHQHCVREVVPPGVLGKCLIKTDLLETMATRLEHVCCQSDQGVAWIENTLLH